MRRTSIIISIVYRAIQINRQCEETKSTEISTTLLLNARNMHYSHCQRLDTQCAAAVLCILICRLFNSTYILLHDGFLIGSFMECFQHKIVVHLKIQFKFLVCRQVVSRIASHIEMQTALINCIFGHKF